MDPGGHAAIGNKEKGSTMFFGHTYELIIVLVLALVFFGPKRLPELGSSIGKGIKEFKKATNDIQETFNTSSTSSSSTSLPPETPHDTTAAYTHTDVEYTAAPLHSEKETTPRA